MCFFLWCTYIVLCTLWFEHGVLCAAVPGPAGTTTNDIIAVLLQQSYSWHSYNERCYCSTMCRTALGERDSASSGWKKRHVPETPNRVV